MALTDFDLVVVHMVRHPEIIDQATIAGLVEEDFKGIYFHYGLVWGVASRHYVQQGVVVPKLLFDKELDTKLSQIPLITSQLERKLSALTELIWGLTTEELVPDYIVSKGLLQQLIDEIKLKPKVQELSQAAPGDIAGKLRESQQTFERTRVVGAKAADMFSLEGRRKHTDDSKPVLTGVKFIDAVTRGGLRPCSMIGLLAESSGGKTMVGTQMLCEQAISNPPRYSVGFYYEQSLEGDIAERFYSYLAEMPRSVSQGKNYDEYPQEYRDKLDQMAPHLQKYLSVMNMSGAVQNQGNGGPDEIEAYITRQSRLGQKPEFVIVDWLDPMVRKHFNLPKEVKLADHREKIVYTLTRLKEIKDRYKVTMVILHQITPADIKDKTPAFQPDWTVAAECKSFGFLMDYVFTFGRRCESTHCMWFNSPKARGAPRDHRIVLMDAEYNRIRDVHHSFEGNKTGKRDGFWFTKLQRRSDGSIPAGGKI